MIRAVTVATAVAACGTPPVPVTAPTRPLRASGSLSMLADRMVGTYVAAAGKLIVLEDGFLVASAMDAATGELAWRTPLQAFAYGRQKLYTDGSKVIAWLGDERHVLDVETGTRLGSYTASERVTASGEGGCSLALRGGACAEHCECSIQLFDCGTAQPLGERYAHTLFEFEIEGERSVACSGPGSWLVGRVGDLTLLSIEDGSRGSGRAQVTVAIDSQVGKEVWRSEHDDT